MAKPIPLIPQYLLQAIDRQQQQPESLRLNAVGPKYFESHLGGASTKHGPITETTFFLPNFEAPKAASLSKDLENSFTSFSAAVRASIVGKRADSPIAIFDAGKAYKLVISYTPETGKKEDGPDIAANSCYESARVIDGYCRDVWNRYPIDNSNKQIVVVVHAPGHLDNAFWAPEKEAIYFGDVSPGFFKPLDQSEDVFWHETGHAIDSFTVKNSSGKAVGLTYQGESGAISEHWADVTAITVKHMKYKTDAASANWLIAEGIIDGPLKSDSRNALRSMDDKLAFDRLGSDEQPAELLPFYRDTQPKEWSNFLPTNVETDDGNVHFNSGPLSHGFKRVSEKIGGNSWEKPGNIWYHTLQSLAPDEGFETFVHKTVRVSKNLYGDDVSSRVQQGWQSIGFDFRKPAPASMTIVDPLPQALDWRAMVATAGIVGIVGANFLSTVSGSSLRDSRFILP